MSPPPFPRADYDHVSSITCGARTGARITHRDQEQDTGHHNRERGPAPEARPDVTADANNDRPDSGHHLRPVGEDAVSTSVRRVGRAREDDHRGHLCALDLLKVREGGAERVEGHEEERRPPRERLPPPWPGWVTVASWAGAYNRSGPLARYIDGARNGH